MTAKIEKINIHYKGKQVTARKLNVASEIPINIDIAWMKVKTSKLLEFVAHGKVKFKPTGGNFPALWKEGETVTTHMAVYGFVPFGHCLRSCLHQCTDKSQFCKKYLYVLSQVFCTKYLTNQFALTAL